MYPKYHIFFGLILSVILFLISPNYIGLLGAGIIFLSSFLIDVDHYIYYLIKDKSFSLKKAFQYFSNARIKFLKLSFKKRREYYSGFCFFHGIEWIILFLVLGFLLSKYLLFIAIGFTFHLCLDWIEEYSKIPRMDKVSVIYDFFKFKKLKRIW
jgi:hypothetical protein